jgi:hypothetical protein
MDFSDSMYAIVRECFPNATIVIDCFHIVQRLCEALDEMRLRFKRLAVTATKKEEAAWKKSEDAKARKRAYGRTKYAVKKGGKKKPKGRKRGRKRIGKKKFRPTMLSTGDTLVELLTRGKYVLAKSGEKWGKHQKERAHLLFELYPKLREAYSLICTIRAMFRNKNSQGMRQEAICTTGMRKSMIVPSGKSSRQETASRPRRKRCSITSTKGIQMPPQNH